MTIPVQGVSYALEKLFEGREKPIGVWTMPNRENMVGQFGDLQAPAPNMEAKPDSYDAEHKAPMKK